MMKENNKIIIWPQYLNKNISLSEGRKVSLEQAAKNPSVNDIARALKRLGIDHEVEKDKSYPGKWYEKSGRVVALTDKSKGMLLEEICSELKTMK